MQPSPPGEATSLSVDQKIFSLFLARRFIIAFVCPTYESDKPSSLHLLFLEKCFLILSSHLLLALTSDLYHLLLPFTYVPFNLLKPTGHVMHHQFNIQQLYALPTQFMCFVFIWEQTANCATYSINWLVFITEMKSIYSEVRTGSLNKAVCPSSLKV